MGGSQLFIFFAISLTRSMDSPVFIATFFLDILFLSNLFDFFNFHIN